MHKTRVGVLRGGPSNEYEISLNSGASVLDALRKHHEAKYQPHDIFIDREGVSHIDGVPVNLEDIVHRVDVIFNALHGAYGEDGKVQTFFETHGVPFTGSGSMGSAVGMNKVLSKKIFIDHEIRTPRSSEYYSDEIGIDPAPFSRGLFHTLHLPVVVKPAGSGSSVGVSIVKGYDLLPQALSLALQHGDVIIIEEFIPGVEATCGVVEGFRGQELYALPVIEIRPQTEFFDYEAKYQGKSSEIVPATFSDKIKIEIEELAKKIHRALGLKHYSRSDFIVHPRRGIYALEVNTLPGLTDESLIPKALRAVGSDLPEFADYLIGLAMHRDK